LIKEERLNYGVWEYTFTSIEGLTLKYIDDPFETVVEFYKDEVSLGLLHQEDLVELFDYLEKRLGKT